MASVMSVLWPWTAAQDHNHHQPTGFSLSSCPLVLMSNHLISVVSSLAVHSPASESFEVSSSHQVAKTLGFGFISPSIMLRTDFSGMDWSRMSLLRSRTLKGFLSASTVQHQFLVSVFINILVALTSIHDCGKP